MVDRDSSLGSARATSAKVSDIPSAEIVPVLALKGEDLVDADQVATQITFDEARVTVLTAPASLFEVDYLRFEHAKIYVGLSRH
ncbi:hypothetical protein [Streptomyces chartreusis]|uniref:hypothetical protein n=1 Tax=Streptomyces chartreusis TaxID=1969 RepID=UPI0036DC540E